MWEKLRVVFTIPELRQKILLTLLLLAIYRVGYQIPLPILDQTKYGGSSDSQGLGSLLQQASLFSASNLRQITIFGLGIMPYISASIILQLLSSVWKPLEELRKEGETGRKKINEYTRYLTVALCLMQSTVYLSSMTTGDSSVHEAFTSLDTVTNARSIYWGWFTTAVLMMTCGTVFLMWVGEQIDEYGIGNGISLLIMAGILAQMPNSLLGSFQGFQFRLTRFDGMGIEVMMLMAVLFVAVVFAVVFITLGKRSIPVQSAKHVRGRRVYGGNRSGLLLRINQSGVMPIIFASSLLMLPTMLFSGLAWLTRNQGTAESQGWFMAGMNTFFVEVQRLFSQGSTFSYNVLYVAMIYFFSYFWTAITFNPKEMADNLKDYGTFIPGYRPGRRTADYLENVMTRITYVGAAFLALVALVPSMISTWLSIPADIASFYGGTALLIAVSVAFDLVQKIDSHLVMRNYRGLLES